MARVTRYCEEMQVRVFITRAGLDASVPLVETIDLACDDIDSKLARRYSTPIPISNDDPEKLAGTQLLRVISSQLSAGWIICAMSAADPEGQTNRYGRYLIEKSYEVLQQIIDGELSIDFAQETPSETKRKAGPLMAKGMDSYSQVDMYYHNFEPEGFAPGRRPMSGGAVWPPV